MNTNYAKYYGVRGLPKAYIIGNDYKIKNFNPPIFEDKNFYSFILKQ